MIRADRHGGRAQLAEIVLMAVIAVLMFWLMATALPDVLAASVYAVGVAVALVVAVREADRYVCAQRPAYSCQACRTEWELRSASPAGEWGDES